VSEESAHTSTPCEQLLDYAYGELDEAGRRAFEAHLASCARCAAELKSFGRVRTATERLMPKVEPSEALTGALHAQLMHAAAQRKPKRGGILAFPRKLIEHPGWAAAAMFVIVGGAITIGKLSMPESASAPATQMVAPPSAPATAAEPAAKPAEEGAVAAQPVVDKRDDHDGFGTIGKGYKESQDKAPSNIARDGMRVRLNMPPAGTMKVERAPARHAKAAGKSELQSSDGEDLKLVQPKLGDDGVEGGRGSTHVVEPSVSVSVGSAGEVRKSAPVERQAQPPRAPAAAPPSALAAAPPPTPPPAGSAPVLTERAATASKSAAA
jgi:hypothetical protein